MSPHQPHIFLIIEIVIAYIRAEKRSLATAAEDLEKENPRK